MSAEKQSLILTYTPLQGGDGESRWIRLEQERPEDESLTLDEAAEIIDSLYEIEPCDDGMGGGGEEADPENEPEEEEFDEAMAEMLRRAGICNWPEYWETVVRVYRSHKRPGYVLRSETAEVRATEPVRESHRQVVEASGAVIELEMPYDGGLTGIPAGVKWTVRGSTVNLDRPLAGRLALRYATYYERVTLRIPTREQGQWRDALGMATGSPFDISGGGSSRETPTRAELPAASVIAFWDNFAASCELEPPPADEDVDEATIREICGKDEDDEPGDKEEPGGCWKTVHHYSRCNCSRSITGEWDEEVSAPCGGAAAGSFVGREEAFGGFVHCDGEEDNLHDIEFYRRHCCTSPQSPSDLPRCRRSYREYRGGHEIENGPEHWKNIYGDNVSMIAVLPESGTCGEEITEWNVPQRNCCDGVPPLEPSSENPEHIYPGGTYLIKVGGGKDGELTWRATGGLTFRDSGGTTYKTTSRGVYVVAGTGICPKPTITVNDGCDSLVMRFAGPDAEPPTLPEDMAVAPESTFSVTASGGVPPYMWQASGLDLLGWSPDGGRAYFKTREKDSWCTADITVVDVCGQDATMTIMNAETGKWELVPQSEYDVCDPPGAPFDIADENVQRITTKPSGGYYALVAWTREQGYKRYGFSCDTRSGLWSDCKTNNQIALGSKTGPMAPGYCTGESGDWRYEMTEPCCCRYYHSQDPTGWGDQLTTWWQYTGALYRWKCQT